MPLHCAAARRETHVDRLGLACADLHGGRVRLEAVLAYFDAVTARRELHLQAAATFRTVPPLAVDRDDRVDWLHADVQCAESGGFVAFATAAFRQRHRPSAIGPGGLAIRRLLRVGRRRSLRARLLSFTGPERRERGLVLVTRPGTEEVLLPVRPIALAVHLYLMF